MNEYNAIVEGLLFLSGDEGLNEQQLSEATLLEIMELRGIIDDLMKQYLSDEHGIELVNYGGFYKFVSKAKIHEYAEVLFSSTKMATLSSAALETLAIIAYKQPITRVEIEEIRGVNCDMMVRKLLARAYIEECGRTDAPGRPFLYKVTPLFMDAFKLESLKELPDLPVIEVSSDEDLFGDVD